MTVVMQHNSEMPMFLITTKIKRLWDLKKLKIKN